MNIGLLLITDPGGSAERYSENLIACLKRYDAANNYIVFHNRKDLSYQHYASSRWEVVFLKNFGKGGNAVLEMLHKLLAIAPFSRNLVPSYSKYNDIKKYNLDVLFSPTPSLAGYYCRMPYAITIFDLMHKYYSEFPERSYLSRIRRDLFYRIQVRHAKLVIADSIAGKGDIMKFYRVPEGKIEVFPCIPISYNDDVAESFIQSVNRKYNLPSEYIFYPACLHYHKNHLNIVKALHLLRHKYSIELVAVFTGSKANAFNDIMSTVEDLDMENQIRYLGYVSDNEVQALYRKAIALVMPTFFGPANIPVWEAFASGCPVITSNVCGIPEQVGEAGLLVDPRSIKDIADKIYKVYTDKHLRKKLSEKGLNRVKYPGAESYTRNLIAALKRAVES